MENINNNTFGNLEELNIYTSPPNLIKGIGFDINPPSEYILSNREDSNFKEKVIYKDKKTSDIFLHENSIIGIFTSLYYIKIYFIKEETKEEIVHHIPSGIVWYPQTSPFNLYYMNVNIGRGLPEIKDEKTTWEYFNKREMSMRYLLKKDGEDNNEQNYVLPSLIKLFNKVDKEYIIRNVKEFYIGFKSDQSIDDSVMILSSMENKFAIKIELEERVHE